MQLVRGATSSLSGSGAELPPQTHFGVLEPTNVPNVSVKQNLKIKENVLF